MNKTVGLTDCPHAEFCGGCTYRGLPYEIQLERKNAIVLEYLAASGIRCGEYAGMSPSPRTDAYRNKMEYTFGDTVKDGPMTLGLHRKRSYMSVINVDGCRIITRDFDAIRQAVLTFAHEKGYSFRHKRSGQGFLRNLVLRRGEGTGELLINLITTTNGGNGLSDDFAEMLLSLTLEERIAGILHTAFDGKGDVAGCDSMRVLYGRDHYFEEMLGLRFKVNAQSFFQTNTSAVARMFTDAVAMVPDVSGKHVYDVYCGTGAVSLALAPVAAYVTGIEIVGDSVRAARENAALNHISNCCFIEGDALEVLEKLDDREFAAMHGIPEASMGRPNLMVVDPPRMGIHPKALKKIIACEPPELLYISCNPKTFCENMAVFQAHGYRLESLKSYDNFPYTKHIELTGYIVKR